MRMTVDFIRLVAMFQGAFVFGLAFYIFMHHASYHHYTGNKLLRRHIVTIALSYVLLTLFVGLELVDRFGDPLTYRTPLGIIAFGLGDYALATMVKYVYRREQAARNDGPPESEPDPEI